MHQIYYIRENPLFMVEFQKNHLKIRTETEPKTTKLYEYKTIKAAYLKKEIDILPYLTRNVIASLIIGFMNKRKPKILIIETQRGKDEIELKKCNIEKVKAIIVMLSDKIKRNKL